MKWNISNERGIEIIHKTIIELLRSQPSQTMPLQELIHQLNSRTNHIKFHTIQKHNSSSKYIKSKFGGFTHFIETHTLYTLYTSKNIQYIQLLEYGNIDESEQRILLGMDWVLV